MSAVIRERSAALVCVWLGASHRYKAIFRQIGKQMYSNIIPFTSHLFCQAICTLPETLSLSSAQLSELWVHYTPLTALYEVIVATLTRSLIRDCQKRWAADQRRSRESRRVRKRSAGSNWHITHSWFTAKVISHQKDELCFKTLICSNANNLNYAKRHQMWFY